MGQTNDGTKPRKRGTRSQEKAPRFDSSRFVNYELDAGQQAECKGWDISPDAVWKEVEALVDDGHTVSVKFDTFSESYACFIRGGNGDTDPHRGFILSGRGSTAWKSVKQALYKISVLDDNWAEYAEKRHSALDD